MATESDRAFEEFTRKLAYLPGRREVWHAAVAWATARERERAIAEARAVQVAYERLAHNGAMGDADQYNAAAFAAIEIDAAIRSANGGGGNG